MTKLTKLATSSVAKGQTLHKKKEGVWGVRSVSPKIEMKMLIILLSLLIISSIANAEDAPQPIKVGEEARDFTLVSLNGEKTKLADFRGNILVLSIGNPKAKDAVKYDEHLLHLERVYADYKEKTALTVLAVVSQNRESVTQELNLRTPSQFAYPILFDPKDTVAALYGVKFNPTILIVDTSQKVRYILRFLHWMAIEENIETILASESGRLKNIGHSTVDSAVKVLRDANDYVRWNALKAVGNMADKAKGIDSTVPSLIARTNDQNRFVRCHAIVALGKVGSSRAKETFIRMLKSEDAGVRELSAEALGQLRDKSALIKPLTDEAALVRLASIKVLRKMKDEKVIPHLVQSLRDDYINQIALDMLIDFGKPAVWYLMQGLEEKEQKIRANAAYVLWKIGGKIGLGLIEKALEQEGRETRIAQKAPGELAQLFYFLGRDYKNRKMYDEAIAVYKKALMLFPKDAPLRVVANYDLDKCNGEVSKRQIAQQKETQPEKTQEKPEPKPETTVAQTQKKTETEKKEMTKRAPDFALIGIDSKQVKLSDLRGKVVMVHFWALWSGANAHQSMNQLQNFIDIYKRYGDKGFEMLGVVVDEKDADTIKSFRDTYDVNFRLLIGDDNVTKSYGGVEDAPLTFVIDKEGNIYSKHAGYKGRYTYESDVKLLLSK